jgi:hypothetical protein
MLRRMMVIASAVATLAFIGAASAEVLPPGWDVNPDWADSSWVVPVIDCPICFGTGDVISPPGGFGGGGIFVCPGCDGTGAVPTPSFPVPEPEPDPVPLPNPDPPTDIPPVPDTPAGTSDFTLGGIPWFLLVTIDYCC